MGWINDSTLTLTKQRPAGRATRKKRGLFVGARALCAFVSRLLETC